MEDIIKIKKEGYKFFIHKKLYGSMIKYKLKFKPIITDDGPLTFIRIDDSQDAAYISFAEGYSYDISGNIYYSTDALNWKLYTLGERLKINYRGILLFKRDSSLYFSSTGSLYEENPVFKTYGGLYECKGMINSMYNFYIGNSNTRVRFLFSKTNIVNTPNMGFTYTGNNTFSNMFLNCIYLEDASNLILPSTNLNYSSGCFLYMFDGCSSLKKAPIFPTYFGSSSMCLYMFRNCTSLERIDQDFTGNSIGTYAFNYMFLGCTSLKKAPNLFFSGNWGLYCCSFMFSSCSSLVNAPYFTGRSAENGACNYMFYSCSSLVNVQKALPFLTSNTSFLYMFSNCRSLRTPIEIPSASISFGNYFYRNMYAYCDNLESTPVIVYKNDTKFTGSTPCFYEMFRNTYNIKNIYLFFDDNSYNTYFKIDYISNLLEGEIVVSTTCDLTDDELKNKFGKNKTVRRTFNPYGPLTFVKVDEGDGYVSLSIPITSKVVQYRLNYGEWQTYTSNSQISMVKDDVLQFLSTSTVLGLSGSNYFKFATDDNSTYDCYGTVYALYNYSLTTANVYHNSMFEGTSIRRAPDTVVNASNYAYTQEGDGCDYMFKNCTKLEIPPTFNIVYTNRNGQFKDMFYNCSSLVNAPDIPIVYAGTLASALFHGMFAYCSSLVNIPFKIVWPTYNFMYTEMFANCTSLEKAPDILCTDSAQRCYYHMFYNCTKLNYIKCLRITFTVINESSSGMLYNVSSTGTYVKNPNTPLPLVYGSDTIPIGWTVYDADDE